MRRPVSTAPAADAAAVDDDASTVSLASGAAGVEVGSVCSGMSDIIFFFSGGTQLVALTCDDVNGEVVVYRPPSFGGVAVAVAVIGPQVRRIRIL